MKSPDTRHAWALEQLRAAHVRITPVRDRVLARLARDPQPASISDVGASPELRAGFDEVTVYRTLVLLAELEVVKQILLQGRPVHFVLNVPGGGFTFLICRCCGQVTPIASAPGVVSLENQIAREHGYAGVTHEVELYGVCPACQPHTKACGKPSKFFPGLRLRARHQP